MKLKGSVDGPSTCPEAVPNARSIPHSNEVIHLDEEGLESATVVQLIFPRPRFVWKTPNLKARVPLEEVFAADISAETLRPQTPG